MPNTPASLIRYARYVTVPVTVEANFGRGIVRDVPRSEIPAGGMYDCIDYLVEKPGVIYKRGGTAFQSAALEGQALIIGVAAPEFPGDPRVIAVASDGASASTVFDVTTGTPATGLDANGVLLLENPPTFVDDLILCDGNGVYPPQKVYLNSGTVAIADLGGSPPVAKYSCIHLGRLVLANTTDHPNRIWMNPITGTSIEDDWGVGGDNYIDVNAPITGMASIQGVLLVFSRGNTTRILGQFPPGSVDTNDQPNGDMVQQPLGAVGCIDARSIVQMNNLVYFADESGVYYTNGAGYQSITTKTDGTGIGTLWAENMAGFAPSLGSVVCAGVFLNKYLFLTIRHVDADAQAGARFQFLWHEPHQAWVRLADGVTADMYATRFAPNGELYAACGDPDDPVRLLKLSGLFSPVVGNEADANGEAVEPFVEFRPAGSGPGLHHYDFSEITYDMRDTDSSDPSLAVTLATGIEAPTFAAAQEGGTLAATTKSVRSRVMMARESQALTMRITQTSASTSTQIFAVEYAIRADPLGFGGADEPA